MSGINWYGVTVAIVDVGNMINLTEDSLMATEDYQNKNSLGIANWIGYYFRISE